LLAKAAMSRTSMLFPKERQLGKNPKIPAAGADLPPVLRERQSVMALRKG
jgi:hypothetical protein